MKMLKHLTELNHLFPMMIFKIFMSTHLLLDQLPFLTCCLDNLGNNNHNNSKNNAWLNDENEAIIDEPLVRHLGGLRS